jgi:hypothetical protein
LKIIGKGSYGEVFMAMNDGHELVKILISLQ